MLNLALLAIRRGGGPPIPLTRLGGGKLMRVPRSAPLRIALKIAFMLFFIGNGEVLGILFQLQVDRLIARRQTELGMSTVQQA